MQDIILIFLVRMNVKPTIFATRAAAVILWITKLKRQNERMHTSRVPGMKSWTGESHGRDFVSKLHQFSFLTFIPLRASVVQNIIKSETVSKKEYPDTLSLAQPY